MKKDREIILERLNKNINDYFDNILKKKYNMKKVEQTEGATSLMKYKEEFFRNFAD